MNQNRRLIIGLCVVGFGCIGSICLLIFFAVAAGSFLRSQPPGAIPSRYAWHFRREPKGHDTIVDFDPVMLIFEGVESQGSASGSVQIAGYAKEEALSEGLNSDYHNGVAAFQLGDHRIQIEEEGNFLIIGTRRYSLAGKKKTFLIHSDGSSEIYDAYTVPDLSAQEAYQRVFGIWKAGNQPQAERELTGYLRKYPDDAPLLFFKAACTRGRSANGDAYFLFQRLRQAAPSTLQGKCADCLLHLDSHEEPESNFAALRDLIRQHPKDPLLLWMLAMECRDYRNTAGGLQACQSLLKLASPASAPVQQTYANLLSDADRYCEALDHRLLAAKLQPEEWSLNELADTLLVLNMKYSANIARLHAHAKRPKPMSTPLEIAFSEQERHKMFREYYRLTSRIMQKSHGTGFVVHNEPQIQEFRQRHHLDWDQLDVLDAEGMENRWDLR